MTKSIISTHAVAYPDSRQDTYSKATFGFWLYLMTDSILFSALFATYAVLHTSTFGGPTSSEIYNLPLALAETLILLTSSFICGLSMCAANENSKNKVLVFLGITWLLGISFLALEVSEFTLLVREGNSWERSAFLSSYFTLVGTHGLHITAGLTWMSVVIVQIFKRGLTSHTFRRHTCLSIFWHFLDVIWIFIFTIVYLMGAK